MKYAPAERFDGHLDHLDPRTPVTAAQACIWPTIPAHRYLLKSTTATGLLAGLNTQGILIEKVTPGDAHDNCQWLMIAGPIPFLFCIVWKRPSLITTGYKWEIGMSVTGCGIMQKTIELPVKRCNENFVIGPMVCLLTSDHTGADFTAYQVEHDHTLPPA